MVLSSKIRAFWGATAVVGTRRATWGRHCGRMVVRRLTRALALEAAARARVDGAAVISVLLGAALGLGGTVR